MGAAEAKSEAAPVDHGCTGKVAYVTAGKAHQVLKSMLRRGYLRDQQHGARLSVYHCRNCNRYHLGNWG